MNSLLDPGVENVFKNPEFHGRAQRKRCSIPATSRPGLSSLVIPLFSLFAVCWLVRLAVNFQVYYFYVFGDRLALRHRH